MPEPVAAPPTTDERTVSVVGEGMASAVPDTALLHLGVETRGATPGEALDACSRALEEVGSPPASPGAAWRPRSGLAAIGRTIAWLLGWRRLRVRYERSDARFFTFAMLACSAILFNTLQQPPW